MILESAFADKLCTAIDYWEQAKKCHATSEKYRKEAEQLRDDIPEGGEENIVADTKTLEKYLLSENLEIASCVQDLLKDFLLQNIVARFFTYQTSQVWGFGTLVEALKSSQEHVHFIPRESPPLPNAEIRARIKAELFNATSSTAERAHHLCSLSHKHIAASKCFREKADLVQPNDVHDAVKRSIRLLNAFYSHHIAYVLSNDVVSTMVANLKESTDRSIYNTTSTLLGSARLMQYRSLILGGDGKFRSAFEYSVIPARRYNSHSSMLTAEDMALVQQTADAKTISGSSMTIKLLCRYRVFLL